MEGIVNKCLYLNTGAPDAKGDKYDIGAPAIFFLLLLKILFFSAVGASTQKCNNTVSQCHLVINKSCKI